MVRAFTSAPNAMSASKISTFPSSAALCRGVAPEREARFTSSYAEPRPFACSRFEFGPNIGLSVSARSAN
jgi:hypothetical protein